MTRQAFGNHANRFKPPDADVAPPDGPGCIWLACPHPRYADLQVCFAHGLFITGRFRKLMDDYIGDEPPQLPVFQPFVYYLMLSPITVKIGTTRDLPNRIKQLRSEPQYIMAIEPGDQKTERQRHLQFAAERISKREDFTLSERLKAHIDLLQPQRDQLIQQALSRPQVA